MVQVGEVISRNELSKRGWEYVCYFGYCIVFRKGANKILWEESTQKVKSFL
jgi:hypothetical protein